MVKIYLARAMSGRKKDEVYQEAISDKTFFESAGLFVLDPVTEEGVKPSKDTLQATKEQMVEFWKRDKAMIREAHVILDMTPHLKSEGVAHEIGYARYHLWKKIIRVYPEYQMPNEANVVYFEDDYITDSRVDALGEILRTHETMFKRICWRLKLYNRCWWKAFKYRLGEWK